MTFDAARFLTFCSGMGQLAQQFPAMSCTSWGRSIEHNAAVGGKLTSQHLAWTAADVIFDKLPDTIGRVAFETACKEAGLQCVWEYDRVTQRHAHIQLPHR